jgi:tRNA(Ile)-lysidine synthase
MISSGDRIVAAVSGGPDSVCLLEILFKLRGELGISLIVAHLNHGLRPQEDERESRFVATLAKKLDLPYVYERAYSLAKRRGASLEEKARRVRYEFLERALAEHDAQRVALGHNMNDQAETVLMNFLRGSGPMGLSGMPPVREHRFIRPLIRIRRDEIQTYLKEHDLPFMIDSSNLEKRHLRNRIRLDLMPDLLAYQPRLIQHLGDLALLCREEHQFIEEQAREKLDKLSLDSSKRTVELSIVGLKDLASPLQYCVVRQAIEQVKGNPRRVDIGHIRAVIDLLYNPKPQLQVRLPEKLVVTKIYGRLRVSIGEVERAGDYAHRIEHTGKFKLPEIDREILFEEQPKTAFPGRSVSPQEAFVDLEKIKWPLVVRNFRAGDKFMPLGVGGFKKVKDIFIDNKIPSEERTRIPIVKSGNDIMWVCGVRLDDRYRVTEETRRILRCRIE